MEDPPPARRGVKGSKPGGGVALSEAPRTQLGNVSVERWHGLSAWCFSLALGRRPERKLINIPPSREHGALSPTQASDAVQVSLVTSLFLFHFASEVTKTARKSFRNKVGFKVLNMAAAVQGASVDI